MTKSQKAYSPGTAVEVYLYDFSVGAGVEAVQRWMPGTVDEVTQNGKLIDVRVRMDDGSYRLELVGPRGGNKNLRIV